VHAWKVLKKVHIHAVIDLADFSFLIWRWALDLLHRVDR
jgi:hypothetical protein